jgi:hypothetical protein
MNSKEELRFYSGALYFSPVYPYCNWVIACSILILKSTSVKTEMLKTKTCIANQVFKRRYFN